MDNLEKFRALGISECVLEALAQKGFVEPSPIQELTIPMLKNGEKDVVGQAQTGTGKTAAFGIPIIDTLERSENGPQALILSPTRELSIQIADELNSLKGNSPLRIAPFYGGQYIGLQLRKLEEGVDIVIGTPGRIIDLMERGKLNWEALRFAVLDEADEMLDMGFVDDIKQILSQTPADKRMLMFSATMPEEILAIAEQFMRPGYEIVRTQNETVSTELAEQFYYVVKRENKLAALSRILDMENDLYAMIFCKTKTDVDDLVEALLPRGYLVDALHGDIAQTQRTRVISNFKSRRFPILIATDVAARGIDVNDLTHVINFSIPQSPEAYVHRIGRTGRAGKHGTAITFVTPGEVRTLNRIRKTINADIRKGTLPTLEEVIESKKQYFAGSMRQLIEEDKHKRYLSFAEELLTLCDHPAEMIAAMLESRFKDELSAEGKIDFLLKKEKEKPERNSKREKKFSGDETVADERNTARIRFGIGKDDGVMVPEILAMIFKETGIRGVNLGRIDCFPDATYVSASPEDARKIFSSFRGRDVEVTEAAPYEGRSGKPRNAGKHSERKVRGNRDERYSRSGRKERFPADRKRDSFNARPPKGPHPAKNWKKKKERFPERDQF